MNPGDPTFGSFMFFVCFYNSEELLFKADALTSYRLSNTDNAKPCVFKNWYVCTYKLNMVIEKSLDAIHKLPPWYMYQLHINVAVCLIPACKFANTNQHRKGNFIFHSSFHIFQMLEPIII